MSEGDAVKEPRITEPLDVSPARSVARLLIQVFAQDSPGRQHVDQLLRELYERFGEQQDPSPEAVLYIRNYFRRHKDLTHLIKELVKSLKPSCPIHFEDQPELFPGKRPRTEGPCINSLEDLGSVKSFCSYDVLQQTPQVLDLPIDQQHIVVDWKPTGSNVMPDALWDTVVSEEDIAARDDSIYERHHGVSQVYKFAETSHTITLKHVDKVEVDAEGRVNGFNGLKGKAGVDAARSKARKFRRTGTFDQLIRPGAADYLTPKVDGEPIFLNSRKGYGFGVCRLGNTWEFDIGEDIRILIECFPSIRDPTRVFLTNAWRWNIVNNIGVLFGKELLSRKNIVVDIGGRKLPLEFPSFLTDVPADGYVLHQRKGQFFFKDVPTVDIFTPSTKKKLEESCGDNLVVHNKAGALGWEDGKCEYGVHWEDGKCHLRYVKHRRDKLNENDLMNIQEVINAPPIECWIQMFEDNFVTKL